MKTKTLDHFSPCNIYQSDGERNSKGVTIIIKKDIPHTVHKISPTGNYITFSIEYNSETYNIAGLYLEPEDYATSKLKNVMQEIDNQLSGKENIIIIGDFNCIQETKDAKVQTIQT